MKTLAILLLLTTPSCSLLKSDISHNGNQISKIFYEDIKDVLHDPTFYEFVAYKDDDTLTLASFYERTEKVFGSIDSNEELKNIMNEQTKHLENTDNLNQLACYEGRITFKVFNTNDVKAVHIIGIRLSPDRKEIVHRSNLILDSKLIEEIF